MDSSLLRFGVDSEGFSEKPYHPYMPARLIGSSESDSSNSPYSPFSTCFDAEAAFNSLVDGDEAVGFNSSDSSLDRTNQLQQSSLARAVNYDDAPSNFQGNGSEVSHALYSLESFLMDEDCDAKAHREDYIVPNAFSPYSLKQLLIDCAKSLHGSNLNEFERLLQQARSVVSINGEPIQRLGAYLLEGLVARREYSGSNIYRALKCEEPSSKDLFSSMHTLYEICPYFKFGYMAANGAIAEACKNENSIHILDFQIGGGTQWVTLLQALAKRPRGPPHVRITAVDVRMSENAYGDMAWLVGKRLDEISKKFSIPVEFDSISVSAIDLKREALNLRPEDAVVVNFPLLLHHIPDESVDLQNPRDTLLRTVKSFSPKVVTLVEQESNTNSPPFLTRFVETLEYYLAMFESVDVVSMARDDRDRISMEQHCLARDVVNLIACEDKERVERHEVFGKWRSRFTMAGFGQLPLSSYVNSVIKGLLGNYSEDYSFEERDGAMFLGWKHRNVISASAWY